LFERAKTATFPAPKALSSQEWLAVGRKAGDRSPYGVQHLQASATWDDEQVLDDLRAYVVNHLGDLDRVLIVEETGCLKKEKQSAGVQREYSAAAGR
jgi:SRSO17 transposase